MAARLSSGAAGPACGVTGRTQRLEEEACRRGRLAAQSRPNHCPSQRSCAPAAYLPNPGTWKRPTGPWAGAQASRRGSSDICSVPRAALQMEEPWDQPPLTLSGLLGQQGWGCRCSPELGTDSTQATPFRLLNSPQQLPATVLTVRPSPLAARNRVHPLALDCPGTVLEGGGVTPAPPSGAWRTTSRALPAQTHRPPLLFHPGAEPSGWARRPPSGNQEPGCGLLPHRLSGQPRLPEWKGEARQRPREVGRWGAAAPAPSPGQGASREKSL